MLRAKPDEEVMTSAFEKFTNLKTLKLEGTI
jgi:hypothetical protein